MKARELPAGWEWKRLGDICKIQTGQRDVNEGNPSGFYPFFTCSREIFYSNTWSFDCEAILVAGNGVIGETKYYNGKFEAYQRTYVLNNFKSWAPYIFLFLRFNLKKSLFSKITGSTMPYIRKGNLESINIPIPPQKIQHEIVAVLEHAEALKKQRQEADALTGALLQSVFYEMFGDPVRNENGWEIKKLYSILSEDPQNGLYKQFSEYGEDGTPIIRIDSFYDGKIEDMRKLKRIKSNPKEITKYQIQKGDVLINRVNSLEFLGKCGLVQQTFEDTIYECNMIRLRLNKRLVDPTYLTSFLCTKFVKNQILNRAKNAVNQSSINQQDVKELLILVPPLALQQRFARAVESVERIRQEQTESGREIEGLCEGLMQQAFAGELVG